VETELRSHEGCVNRLQWNATGSLLASVSDDRRAQLWSYERRCALTAPIETGHRGNIFGVQFMPESNCSVLATGAMDSQVRVHVLDNTSASNARTTVYTCHSDRVKDLAVERGNASLFWSAGEDGTVRQFDLRESHRCARNGDGACRNALVDVSAGSAIDRGVEFKSVDVNPVLPFYMAVACSDEFVRVYDRRKIRVETAARDSSLYVHMFAPEHLTQPSAADRRSRSQPFATHAVFSSCGRQLLANYSSDHVYLFDLFNDDNVTRLSTRCRSSTSSSSASASASSSSSKSSTQAAAESAAAQYRVRGNAAFAEHMYTQAIDLYSRGLSLDARSSTLHCNRAAALLQRRWRGDIQLALRDCDDALALQPHYAKAMYRRAKTLQMLQRYTLARQAAKQCKRAHPTLSRVDALIDELDKQRGDEDDDDGFDEMRPCRDDDSSSSSSSDDDEKEDDERNESLSVIDPISSRAVHCDERQRFVGHCNVNTDIKEANFFGDRDEFVMAGSDDGRMYIWERSSGALVNAVRADSSVLNCCHPHPFDPVIATSGLENVVRLWAPIAAQPRQVDYALLEENQRRMQHQPRAIQFDAEFLQMLRSERPPQCVHQ
jgi:WD and tetratricopeptide repeats protein 1